MIKPKIISYSRDYSEIKILYKYVVYGYNVNDWLIMERILRRPVFTFKDWNKLKKASQLRSKTYLPIW